MEFNAWYPLFTVAMILSGSVVLVKGLGFLLVSAMKRLMVAWRSTKEWKTPRLSRRLASLAKKPSTALSQEGGGVNPRHPYFSGSMRYLSSPWNTSKDRTYRLLQNPDISFATDRVIPPLLMGLTCRITRPFSVS